MWLVEAVAEFIEWFESQRQRTQERVAAVVKLLERHGPSLGRPYVDRISSSRINKLKELRATSGSKVAVRVLFFFDSRRVAMLLVGGDKGGRWHQWYPEAIAVAEERAQRHEAQLRHRGTNNDGINHDR